jgi:hypothetical protein
MARFLQNRDLRDADLTKLLGWSGYRVYRHEIDEKAKTLKLWVRRKRGHQKLVCSGCGRELKEAHDVNECDTGAVLSGGAFDEFGVFHYVTVLLLYAVDCGKGVKPNSVSCPRTLRCARLTAVWSPSIL